MASSHHEASAGPIVIVGAGLAGLFTALKLAPRPVTVISAAPLGEGASSIWAQGGVAAAVGEGDTPAAHAADTVAAGAGIVDSAVALTIASEARARILDLSDYGVPFDRGSAGAFVLSREAAHTANRVVRVSGDRAGAAIMTALIARVKATPSIRVLDGLGAAGLVMARGRIAGVRLAAAGQEFVMKAGAVVLATGGAGSLYAVTTNPATARGEAIAFAARAGAIIADPEFVQFHPTALDVGIDPAPLATEALRGEGAVLVNRAGVRFMAAIDPRGELAPRDIVARGVFGEIEAGRGAFLDCRTHPGARLEAAFPTVYSFCRESKLDPLIDLLPVAPAAHYHMGGIATDINGRTSIGGLWAVGECASTGLHGANRLASNSLLEAVVVGARVAADLATVKADGFASAVREPGSANGKMSSDVNTGLVRLLRQTMSSQAGVIRDAAGLTAALATIGELERDAGGDPALANMLLTARLIATAALARTESRGGHYRRDYPASDPAFARRTFLHLSGGGRIEAVGTAVEQAQGRGVVA